MLKNFRISRIIGFILDILIVLFTFLIILGLYYVFQIKVLNKDYPSMFGYTFFEVATGSMADTINIGDVVVVKITKDVKENDIIVFRENDSFVTHRLISKNSSEIITKGDANNSEDKPIKEEQILGKVIKIVPKVGIWKKIILSPEVLGLVTILIVLIGLLLSHKPKIEKNQNKGMKNG